MCLCRRAEREGTRAFFLVWLWLTPAELPLPRTQTCPAYVACRVALQSFVCFSCWGWQYWAVHLLAAEFGTTPRQLMETQVTDTDHGNNADDSVYGRGFVMDGRKGVLLLNKGAVSVVFSGSFNGWEGSVLEGVGSEPGYVPPRAVQMRDQNKLTVGAYAIVVLRERPK